MTYWNVKETAAYAVLMMFNYSLGCYFLLLLIFPNNAAINTGFLEPKRMNDFQGEWFWLFEESKRYGYYKKTFAEKKVFT